MQNGAFVSAYQITKLKHKLPNQITKRAHNYQLQITNHKMDKDGDLVAMAVKLTMVFSECGKFGVFCVSCRVHSDVGLLLTT